MAFTCLETPTSSADRDQRNHRLAQRTRDRRRLDQRGQALAETGLSLTLITLLLLGVIEFGRAFMITSALIDSARAGAREASMVGHAKRDSFGSILDTAPIEATVREQIAGIVGRPVANSMTIEVSQASGPTPLAEVRIVGEVPYVFRLIDTSFQVDRTVAFRDQGR